MEQPHESDEDVGDTDDHHEDTRGEVDQLEHAHQEEEEREQSKKQTLNSIAVRDALALTNRHGNYIILMGEHVRPEVGNHHDEIIDREQPAEGATAQHVGNLHTRHHTPASPRLSQILLVLQTAPGSSHPLGGVGNTRLHQGSDDVDDRSNLHASNHQGAHILILVNGAQSVKDPDHEDHGNTVYPSRASPGLTDDVEESVPSMDTSTVQPHLLDAVKVELLFVSTPDPSERECC